VPEQEIEMRHSHVAVLLALCLTSLAYGQDQDVLKVFDGQGRYVGPLVASGGYQVATVIEANQTTIVVPLSRTTNNSGELSASQYEWGDALTETLYYPTTDCSGLPFIAGPAVVRPSMIVRAGAVATVYIAPDTESSTVTVQSYGVPGSCTTLGSNSSVPPVEQEEGWAPESTYPITQHYPEPLSVHY
jgi:hypothetical protein